MGSTLLTAPPLALDFATSSSPAVYGVRNKHRFVGFKDTGNTEAFWSNFMPEGYVGSDISVTIAWMAATAVIGDVDWDIAWERLAAGGQDLDTDSFATPKSSISNVTNAVSGRLIYTTINFSNVEADGIQPNEKFRIRIRRLGDNITDDMVGETQVTDVSINQTAFAGTLTMQEQDATPTVTGVKVIKVDNTTLTDEGGGTVSLASGGGGGGFFTDGVGTDAGIGKGVTAPLASGANSLASGDATTANGDNSISFGDSLPMEGSQVFAQGSNFDPYQAPDSSNSFMQGDYIQSWAAQNSFMQGAQIALPDGFATYDPNSALAEWPTFIQGYSIKSWHGYIDGETFGDSTPMPSFIWGVYHYIYNTTVDGPDQFLVCMGYANDIQGSSGPTSVIGSSNVLLSCDSVRILGDNNDFTTVRPGWFFTDGLTLGTTGISWFVWGTQHANTSGSNEPTNVFMGGDDHHLGSVSNGQTIFLWGEAATNGLSTPNDGFFGWGGGNGGGAKSSRGRCQWSFKLGHLQTTDATANQVLNAWNADNNRAHHIRVEVVAYDTINNTQAAIFHVDHVLGYRTSHNSVLVLNPASPIALTSVNAGGVSATWTARLVTNGSTGFRIEITGSATETVQWTGKISFSTAGGLAV